VHPVISIAYLEPFHKDVFVRLHLDHLNTIVTDGDDTNNQSFKVNHLIDKRITTCCGKKEVKYLVQWKGYGPEYDLWYHESLLNNCKDLINNYGSLHWPVRQIQRAGKRAIAQAINKPTDTTVRTD
jgi:hypothetical protein